MKLKTRIIYWVLPLHCFGHKGDHKTIEHSEDETFPRVEKKAQDMNPGRTY